MTKGMFAINLKSNSSCQFITFFYPNKKTRLKKVDWAITFNGEHDGS